MTNENCLANMSCPECKSEEPFLIHSQALAKVYDDGPDPFYCSDTIWDGDSSCTCDACGWQGVVSELRFNNDEDESEDADCP